MEDLENNFWGNVKFYSQKLDSINLETFEMRVASTYS